jgi:hypothetical protein
MYTRTLSLAALTATLLASCGSNNQATTANSVPLVRAAPGTGDTVTSFQVELATTTNIVSGPGQGHTTSSPEGLRLAYLFDKGNMQVRADVPGSAFPDKQDRIMLIDQQTKTARILLKSTLAADKTYDAATLSQLGQNLAGAVAGTFDLMDKAHPYRTLSADQFLVLARKAAFDVTSEDSKQVILTRTLTSGTTETRLQLTFDAAVGAITKTESKTVTPEAKYGSVNTIQYTDVKGMANTKVPYKIDSRLTGELVGKLARPPIHLPVAAVRLPDKTKPVLKKGQYIAQHFTAVPGEGVTDINKRVSTSTSTFTGLAVNTVNHDFFNPEAK